MHSDRGTIERMKSICRNCKHISVNQEDRYYYCSLYNSVITGIITDCNGFERNEKFLIKICDFFVFFANFCELLPIIPPQWSTLLEIQRSAPYFIE